jgi:hypothetical protein
MKNRSLDSVFDGIKLKDIVIMMFLKSRFSYNSNENMPKPTT